MTVAPLPGLPELFHIGWVVRDCAAAQRELGARLGAGPFVSAGTEARFDQALVHGKPVPFSLRIAFGVLGGVLIELLEPLDDRSPHAEFLDAHGEGMHHLAFLVPDFDEQLAAVRTARPEAEILIEVPALRHERNRLNSSLTGTVAQAYRCAIAGGIVVLRDVEPTQPGRKQERREMCRR